MYKHDKRDKHDVINLWYDKLMIWQNYDMLNIMW